jgi:NAD/NADP transhydrogenase alpha subunit
MLAQQLSQFVRSNGDMATITLLIQRQTKYVHKLPAREHQPVATSTQSHTNAEEVAFTCAIVPGHQAPKDLIT